MIDIKQENEKRARELSDEHASKSHAKGDWHFRRAEMLGGQSDYVAGQDEGEEPQGAYQHQH
jgi:hypothetical protein